MGIGIVAGLLACVHRAPEVSGAAVVDPVTAAADARFAMRGTDPAALADAVDGWTARLATDPTDCDALARLAHAEWLRATAAPGPDAEAHLANGEEFGWRCLLGVPGVQAAMDAAGGAVLLRALDDLPPAAAPCLAWTAANALDRVAVRGPGAALALEDLGAIVRRAQTFGDATFAPWDPNGVPGMDAWLVSRWRLLSATDDAARDVARAEALRAVREGPGILRWRADALAAWPDAGGALPEVDGAARWAYENARFTSR